MKICKVCGAEVPDNASFCAKCGGRMEQEANPQQSQEKQSQDQAGQEQQAQYQQSPNQQYQRGYQQQGQQTQYQQQGQQGQYQQQYRQQGQYQQYYQAPADPYDHTAEFDKKDISDNKVFAMIAYLTGTIGIIIALLAGNKSEYAMFHVRQALKFTVLSTLTGIVALVLCWTIVVPFIAVIFYLVLFVCRIIAFFSICGGKVKEPYIVRSFGFLR